MLESRIRGKISGITSNKFDHAHLILVFAGVRPAMSLFIPVKKVREATQILKTLALYHAVVRVGNEAELFVGEKTRVNGLSKLVHRMPSKGIMFANSDIETPFHRFLHQLVRDQEIMDELKLLKNGVRSKHTGSYASAICIVSHVPCSPRCDETLEQGELFITTLNELAPDLLWGVLQSRASEILESIENLQLMK